jgi:exonuclease SbcC
MRPLELRLRNFRSYFGPDAAFDFRERQLVGIVGPIGSGKSSILDAIAFALYGRTPSVARGTKALIHQRADDAAVALRFEVDGQVWEVQRMLRRKGQSQHALYRLEGDAPDAAKVEQVVQEGEVNARIAELVGLDFDAFGRSVLLAQGRFAEFLTAPPRERDKVLKGVFGYDRVDRMREVAKEKAGLAEIEAQKATVNVDHLADLERENTARRTERDEVAGRLATLEEAQPEVGRIDATEQEAKTRGKAVTKRLADLDDIAERLPEQSDADQLLGVAAAAGEQRTKAATALEAAQLRSEEAAAGLRALESAGEREAIDEAGRALAVQAGHVEAQSEARNRENGALERLAAAQSELADRQDRVENAEAISTTTADAFDGADAAFRGAEEAYHQASHRDMAATLKVDLKVGAACPVCEQDVADLPPGVVAPDLELAAEVLAAARRDRATCEQERSGAQGAHEAARTALVASETRLEETTQDVANVTAGTAAAEARVRAVDDEVARLLDAEDPAEELKRRRDAFDAAGRAAETAREAVDRARTSHDEANSAEREIGARLDDLRVQLADVGGRLGVEPAAGGSVTDAVAEMRQLWLDAGSELRDEKGDAERAVASAVEERHELLERLDVEGSFPEVYASIRARVDLLDEEMDRTARKLAGAEMVIAERDRLVARRDTFAQLGSDLTDARFVRFLLDDERLRLAELGSHHFQRLTGGRYRFSDDGVFDVVDLTAADSVRKAGSLSGGETFLASLALALGLAETVSRSGGRLDAFFLDEGFGTLDPEHLDLAMEGVETLVAENGSRLVVVVSHVAELRHRVEDLIELDRDPITGDTIVVRS